MYRVLLRKENQYRQRLKKPVKKFRHKSNKIYSQVWWTDAATSSKKDIKTNDHLYQYDYAKSTFRYWWEIFEKPALAFLDTETTSFEWFRRSTTNWRFFLPQKV